MYCREPGVLPLKDLCLKFAMKTEHSLHCNSDACSAKATQVCGLLPVAKADVVGVERRERVRGGLC